MVTAVSEVLYEENLDLTNVHTQVDGNRLSNLLAWSRYNPDEIKFLHSGFTKGFYIGYRGPTVRQSSSRNLPFRVGDPTDMWNKIMKEVKQKRVAGPFAEIPYDNYIQSPIGLVPKAGNKTRLIFHLSYNFSDDENGKSVNHHTPKEECTVKYNDLDVAVSYCLNLGKLNPVTNLPVCPVFLAISDLVSAFRMLPLSAESWP